MRARFWLARILFPLERKRLNLSYYSRFIERCGMMILDLSCMILQTHPKRGTPEASGSDILREPEVERAARQVADLQDEMVERMARLLPEDGRSQPLEGVHLYRASQPSDQIYSSYEPSICVIAQGRKEVMLGREIYSYDRAHYLVNSVRLPVGAQIVEASRERPYLCLRPILDPFLVGSAILEANLPSRGQANVKSIQISRLDSGLLDAVVRLVRLLDAPRDARMLMPLVMREIVYRLLVGEQGDRLQHVAVLDGSTHRIAKAVERLRKGFDQPLRVESIAREIGMSVSGFQHHFKTVTSMSPLQFQKHLRLHEARRLMVGEHLDAAGAGQRVGYDDASHFNREYKRLFGLPPMRDVERLRESA
jgi:AraC-like DNA-binding protein